MMTTLEPPALPSAALRAIAQRHGLGRLPFERLRGLGVVNSVYRLGDSLILRAPKAVPEHIAEAYNEALVVPVARRAGVATPAIVAFDASCDLLPVPYAIYERAPGVTLASLDLPPGKTAGALRALGRDLARLHLRVVETPDPLAALPHDEHTDPRPLTDQLATDGYLSAELARWLLAWLERLAEEALAPVTFRVTHNDAGPQNVLVEPEGRHYAALIDWGDTIWSDPAIEFANLPPRTVPFVLAGYRELAGSLIPEVSETRILWHHLDWALHALRRTPQVAWQNWSAQPANRMVELLRFFTETDEPSWSILRP